jgi:hypothetical protein
MKYLLSILLLFAMLSPWVFAVNSVSTNVGSVQSSTWYTGNIPNNWEPKGFVGQILSDIFWASWHIKNEFIAAFQVVSELPLDVDFENNILRWDGNKFVLWGMYDVAWNIWIWTSTISSWLKLDVNGKIWATEYCNTNGTDCVLAWNLWGSSLWNESGSNVYRSSWNVWIRTDTPSVALDVVWTANFDGWIQVNRLKAISSTNATHTAQFTDDTYYGAFEVLNNSWDRGAYFWFGNGWNRVDLHLEDADKLYISGWNVWIWTLDPETLLDVNGKITMREETTDNDSDNIIATKGYVDSQSVQWRYEDYVEKVTNLWEDRVVWTPHTSINLDTCDTDEILKFTCAPDEVRVCRDNYRTQNWTTQQRVNRDEYITVPVYEYHSEIVYCTKATYLVKEEFPDNGAIQNKSWTVTITDRDYSWLRESCSVRVTFTWSPSCNVTKGYNLWSQGSDGECLAKVKWSLASGTLCTNIKWITKIDISSLSGNTAPIDIDYYGF